MSSEKDKNNSLNMFRATNYSFSVDSCFVYVIIWSKQLLIKKTKNKN